MANRLYPIKGSSTRFAVQLQNGAEFARALNMLDLKLSRIVARTAVKEGAQVIADEWIARARALNTTGRGEGHYADSIRVTTRSATIADGGGGRALRGATAVIAPRQIGSVPDDEQPMRYAAVHEFGGRLGPNQGNAFIPARPTARPAFEKKASECVDKVQSVLARMLP